VQAAAIVTVYNTYEKPPPPLPPVPSAYYTSFRPAVTTGLLPLVKEPLEAPRRKKPCIFLDLQVSYAALCRGIVRLGNAVFRSFNVFLSYVSAR